jgi:hypothetical protein
LGASTPTTVKGTLPMRSDCPSGSFVGEQLAPHGFADHHRLRRRGVVARARPSPLASFQPLISKKVRLHALPAVDQLFSA